MKRKPIIIALALGLISVVEWSWFSQVYAAHLKPQANHQQGSKSHNDQKTSADQKEIENGPVSKVKHENENLPCGSHAYKDGENVDHQFEGVE